MLIEVRDLVRSLAHLHPSDSIADINCSEVPTGRSRHLTNGKAETSVRFSETHSFAFLNNCTRPR